MGERQRRTAEVETRWGGWLEVTVTEEKDDASTPMPFLNVVLRDEGGDEVAAYNVWVAVDGELTISHFGTGPDCGGLKVHL